MDFSVPQIILKLYYNFVLQFSSRNEQVESAQKSRHSVLLVLRDIAVHLMYCAYECHSCQRFHDGPSSSAIRAAWELAALALGKKQNRMKCYGRNT